MTLPSSPEARLRHALALHRARRLAEAKREYEGVLAAWPEQPDALHLLGVLLTEIGRAADAADLIARATRRMPQSVDYWLHLGDALAAARRAGTAGAAWRKALLLDPRRAEACFGMAGQLLAAGHWRDAERQARRTVALLPDAAPPRFRLGLALEGLGRPADALAEYRQAARRTPLEWELHRRIRMVSIAAGAAEDAWQATRRSVLLRPDVAEGLVAIEATGGAACEALQRARWARRGCVLAPAEGFLRAVAAGYRVDRWDYAGALEETRQALVAGPDSIVGYRIRARVTNMLPRLELARQAVRWGMCVAPKDAELTYQAAQVELAIGDLAKGWLLHEARVRGPRFHRTAALPPRWNGPGSPAGRLLVATEQGIGDELLFLSCLPDLLEDVSSPVVELDERLHPLFSRGYPSVQFVPRQARQGEGGRAVFDYTAIVRQFGITQHLHAGSLPALYRADRSSPATRRAYLSADEAAVGQWKGMLEALGPEPKVGICWRSIVRNAARSIHYAPLTEWEPLLRLRGITFVSLQYDDAQTELAALRDRRGIELWTPPDLDQLDDLDGTAALISALDAVVSAPTAVCMASAALGVETLRIGHSTYSIGVERDHFFPAMLALSPWGQPLDLALALRRAAEALPRILGQATKGARG